MCLLLAGIASAAPPTPMLWKASKGDSTVWLLGSMHSLKEGDYPLSHDVDVAYKEAHRLVFEIAPAELTSPATLALTLQHGMYQDPAHRLQDDLPAPMWQQVEAYGAKNSLPEIALQRFEPWMLALTMVELESQKIGMTPDKGLDMHFMKMAEADHKPTGGFETVDQQLSIFYTMSLKDQQEMVRQTLDEMADFPKEMNDEHDIWRRGDSTQLIAQAQKQFAGYPELYQKLLAQRNRNWIPLIEKMLSDPGQDTLVIVGALHLSGPDGVVHLLQQKGYTVQRICTGCSNAH